ncbi:hypothetical protein GUITHDRAFT_117056 [Guillardia theta CCMP2712]|uniref:Uncharacterized protein n=1 Tax=Guillardia theta (strain CCMP2712) TaxID=905079 RepID=L1IKI4_GUITC|nr:hypothetical protein GUITHDRAFT_117056 [Guillardia theta CCMP2712]EKX36758.1 hypothetical protein GUITHDRAFT_117056 [Guillardia theta CCMP2712]|eukprot:XP_005823738.1 hypothetical protein GUITHDRAFT_117056 [Guillardia theta CCMP2712]
MKRLQVTESSFDSGPLSARKARNLPPIFPKGLIVSFKADGKRTSMTLSSDRSSLVPYIPEEGRTVRPAPNLQEDSASDVYDSPALSSPGMSAQTSNISEHRDNLRAHAQSEVKAKIDELQQGHVQMKENMMKENMIRAEYLASNFTGKHDSGEDNSSQLFSRTGSQTSTASSANEFFLTEVENAEDFASKFASVRRKTSIVLSSIQRSIDQKSVFNADVGDNSREIVQDGLSRDTFQSKIPSSSQAEETTVNVEEKVVTAQAAAASPLIETGGESQQFEEGNVETQTAADLEKEEEQSLVGGSRQRTQQEERKAEAPVLDRLVVEHDIEPTEGRSQGVFEEIATSAGQSGTKALTVESALTELYQLHDLKAQISRSNLAHIYDSAQQERTGWKKKIRTLSTKMSQISFPYALLVYQPMTDKVTLLSVWGESISEVSSCPFSDVIVKKRGERTDGSSNIPAGTVQIRIPSVSALPPTVLFPVDVWTKIVEGRSQRNIHRTPPPPRTGARSADFTRSLSRTSSSLDGARARSLRDRAATSSSQKLVEKDLPKTVEELRRLNNYVGFVIPGMHDDVNVEIVPLHLSGSVSSWSPNDGHQEQEIMPGVSKTIVSGATPQGDKIKTDSLEAGKGQKEDKGAEDSGDKDRTFTIKESAELSPTNKLRFAEVVALCEDLFMDELGMDSLVDISDVGPDHV